MNNMQPRWEKTLLFLVLTAFLLIHIIYSNEIVYTFIFNNREPGDNSTVTCINIPENFRVYSTNWSLQQSLLPSLTTLTWPKAPVAALPAGSKDSHGYPISLPPPFEPAMSHSQRNLLRQLLIKFSKVMFENALGDRFMLYGGTLIGSLRHHDFIPWDEDIDVLVDESVRKTVQSLLRKLEPEYSFAVTKRRDKFFGPLVESSEDHLDINKSRRVLDWGWPFLDIQYYRTNDTHIWDIANPIFMWSVEVVFPLHFAPFGNHWYPAPKNSFRFTKLTYDLMNDCRSIGFSHIRGYLIRSQYRNCSDLVTRYAFVHTNDCHLISTNSTLFASEMRDWTMCWSSLMELSSNNQAGSVVLHRLCLPVLEGGEDVINWGI